MTIMRVRFRIPPVAIYLTFLFLYGLSMMISTTRKKENSLMEFYADQEGQGMEDFALKDIAIRRKKLMRKTHDSPISSVKDFFNRLNTSETICKRLTDVGGSSCNKVMDNNKYFCLDDDVFIPANNCNVYSFGVGDDVSFDFSMTKYGCNVYMFDPSLSASVIHKEIERFEKLHFIPVGLNHKEQAIEYQWTYSDDKKQETVKGYLDTFSNIRKKIQHDHLPVHYLKMDIEGSEWTSLPQMFETGGFDGVKQFAIEIHAKEVLNATEKEAIILVQNMWNTLNGLQNFGFRRVKYTPTAFIGTFYKDPKTNELIPTCGEIFYIKRT